MTLEAQTQIYWQVQRAWNLPQASANPPLPFGAAVKHLRTIIDAPANPRILFLAQRLLNDIVANTVSPQVPNKIYDKRADMMILDDVNSADR